MSIRGLYPVIVLATVLPLSGLTVTACRNQVEPSVCEAQILHPEWEEEEEADEEEGLSRRQRRRAAERRRAMIRPVRAREWLYLITEQDRWGGHVSDECTETAIEQYEPSQSCREAEEEARRENPELYEEDDTPQPIELVEEHLIQSRLTNRHRLVWVVTHRYPNGDGLGPIALVERRLDDEVDTIHVLAVGSLRARYEATRLRLITVREPLLTLTEQLICPEPEEGEEEEEVDLSQCERREEYLIADGIECRNNRRPRTWEITRELRREMREDDSPYSCDDDEDIRTCYRRFQMIIVEGETCVEEEQEEDESEDEASADAAGDDEEEEEPEEICNRSANFMFRDEHRFHQAELHHISGRCLGRAQMLYSERTEREIAGGWQRRFDLAATYEFAGARMVIHQQVMAVDLDPRRDEVPPRPFRRAEADAHWFLFQGRFVTPNESLWNRMLLRHGSLQVPEEQASR